MSAELKIYNSRILPLNFVRLTSKVSGVNFLKNLKGESKKLLVHVIMVRLSTGAKCSRNLPEDPMTMFKRETGPLFACPGDLMGFAELSGRTSLPPNLLFSDDH